MTVYSPFSPVTTKTTLPIIAQSALLRKGKIPGVENDRNALQGSRNAILLTYCLIMGTREQ